MRYLFYHFQVLGCFCPVRWTRTAHVCGLLTCGTILWCHIYWKQYERDCRYTCSHTQSCISVLALSFVAKTFCYLLGSLLQLYGKRAAWEDPSKWVIDTYPWSSTSLQHEGQSLLQLRPEDVGYDGYSSSKDGATSKQVSQSDTEGDPLVKIAS